MNIRIIRRYLIATCLLLSMPLYASSSLEEAYRNGSQTASGVMRQSENAINHFNPQNIFEKYTPNPKESGLFKDETTTTSDLSARATENALTQEDAQTIIKSFEERPLITVSPSESGIKKGQLISHDAANIVNGISDQFIDCNKTQECHTEYTKETCEEAGGLGPTTCHKDLIVNVIPANAENKKVSVVIDSKTLFLKKTEATYTVDLEKGVLRSGNDTKAPITVGPKLTDISCAKSQVTYQASLDNNIALSIQTLPDCQNHFQTTFTLRAKSGLVWFPKATIYFDIRHKAEDSVTEQWVSSCSSLEQKAGAGSCQKISETCTKGPESRIINGKSVTRSCWQKKTEYTCQKSDVKPQQCEGLRQKGCEQINSICTQKLGDTCLRYEQTFRCPKTTCSGGIGVVCGSNAFCLEGKCSNPTKTKSQDFERSVSALSGAADASKQFDEKMIFRGHAKSCRKDAVGFRNCCKDTGWGQDINLAHCDDEEKALGHDKENKLTIDVGEYCAHSVLGVCVEQKEAYCTFSSKLARIIQQQGRQGQLGIGFGDGETPNCQGLTPEQLQNLDFSRIDFSEFYDELKQKMKLPNTRETNQRIKEAIERQYQGGHSHG